MTNLLLRGDSGPILPRDFVVLLDVVGYYLYWGLFVSRLKQNLSLYLSSNIPLV